MRKLSFTVVLLVAGLTAHGVAAAGRGIPAPQPPMIMKTAVDPQAKTLVITGRNFGASTPTVLLADQPLEVKNFSEHEVVANLPSGLPAATYAVSVTTSGSNRTSSNLFSATLPSSKKTGL